MNKIIAVVGMTGSGKTEASEYIGKKGYKFLRFGQITLDEIKRKGLTPNEANEKAIRERLRKEYGMGAFAVLNMPKIDELLQTSNVVVDGLYSWTEYTLLKEKYGEKLITLAIYSSPNTRYKRLTERKLEKDDIHIRKRPASVELAKARDIAEIENIQKAGPIAMADHTIINEASLFEFKQNIDKLLEKLK